MLQQSTMEENNMEERKIIVVVDESEESMYALSWCLVKLVPKFIHWKYPNSPLDVSGIFLLLS